MQCKNVGKAMYYLVVILALVSSLALVGCSSGDGGGGGGTTSTSNVSNVSNATVPLTASNVQAVLGEPFTFQPGSIFDPSIGSNPATLTFDTATTSSVTSEGAKSSGTTTFGSCTLSFTQGPLAGAGKSITFTTCSLQVNASNVTVGSGSVNGTITLTLTGPNGSGTSLVITVQVSIMSNGTLVINGVATGITISGTTGSTGLGGTT